MVSRIWATSGPGRGCEAMWEALGHRLAMVKAGVGRPTNLEILLHAVAASRSAARLANLSFFLGLQDEA